MEIEKNGHSWYLFFYDANILLSDGCLNLNHPIQQNVYDLHAEAL